MENQTGKLPAFWTANGWGGRITTQTADPITAAGWVVQCESLLVQLGWGRWGGAVWQLPLRVKRYPVTNPTEITILPIVDVTRWAQLTMLFITFILVGWRINRRRS